MSDDQKSDTITEELKKEIRKEVVSKVSKGVVAGGLFLAAFALGAIYLALQTQLPRWLGSVPDGAIIAFDRRAGCPDGWSPYKKSYGRTIVGAIYSGNRVETEWSHKIEDTAKYHFGEYHGKEKVTLTEEHVPDHVHGMGLVNLYNLSSRSVGVEKGGINMPWYLEGSDGLKEGYEGNPNVLMKSFGKGGAHENMPPYIALYHCQKGGSLE